jgi:hypothetical protein
LKDLGTVATAPERPWEADKYSEKAKSYLAGFKFKYNLAAYAVAPRLSAAIHFQLL